VCCDPRLLKTETTKKKNAKSAKLELLVSLIVELLEEGRRILLFSQFIEMLALIEDELNKRKLTYLKLTGKTKDRETPVKRKLKKNRNKNFSNPFSTEPA
jgi:SNF2 family DNA or RNA helicase